MTGRFDLCSPCLHPTLFFQRFRLDWSVRFVSLCLWICFFYAFWYLW